MSILWQTENWNLRARALKLKASLNEEWPWQLAKIRFRLRSLAFEQALGYRRSSCLRQYGKDQEGLSFTACPISAGSCQRFCETQGGTFAIAPTTGQERSHAS